MMKDFNSMTPQEAENLLKQRIRQFSDFSTVLATKRMPEFAPPFKDYAEHKGDIISFLYKTFREYKKRVSEIDCLEEVNTAISYLINRYQVEHGNSPLSVSFDIVRDVDALCKAILKALNAYFSGFPAKAYEVMEEAFLLNSCHLLMLLPQIVCEKGSMHFYRMRKGKKEEPRDLFHVPFNERYKTSNYRFSINGTPSLYCAHSLETCIMENRIPAGSEISVAEFSFPADKGIRVVDLTLPGSRNLSIWEEYSLILFYPLILACGLKVRHEDASFKEEYVIPQLFYQVVRMHGSKLADDIRGIAYVSTRYANPDFTDSKMRNYALFVYDCQEECGYDEKLAAMMTIKGPISLQYDGPADLEVAKDELKTLLPCPISL